MKKIVFFLVFLFPLICFFQNVSAKKVKNRKLIKQTARQQINQLKEGAILVRLMTKKNSILALRYSGREEQADRIECEQIEFNKRVICAFKKNFSFCKVYFFFNDNSLIVKDKKFNNIFFLTIV